jgi:hypothetical protein
MEMPMNAARALGRLGGQKEVPPMRISRLPTAQLAVLLAVAVGLVLAPAAGAKTTKVKIRTGTTTLTFNPQANQNLAAMGIAVGPVAPATAAAGPILTFPIRKGTLKVTGVKRKKVTGTVTHAGGMTLSTATFAVAMNRPVVALATTGSTMNASILLAATPAGSLTMADVNLSNAKVTLTRTRVKLTGIVVRLNATAAGAMNAAFQVTGFSPGFLVGSATLSAALAH